MRSVKAVITAAQNFEDLVVFFKNRRFPRVTGNSRKRLISMKEAKFEPI
jgi:hypothetical protein